MYLITKHHVHEYVEQNVAEWIRRWTYKLKHNENIRLGKLLLYGVRRPRERIMCVRTTLYQPL